MQKHIKVELPRYNTVEKNFFNRLRKELGSDILLYCLVGSLGRQDVVCGWSDIDILIVIKKYTCDILEKINKTIAGNNKDIKIGITLYTYKDFINNKDPKTIHYIESILNNIYHPRIIDNKLKLTYPNLSTIKVFDWVDFTQLTHTLKRELLLLERYDEKKTYKIIIALLKILLRSKGITEFSGYTDVIMKTNKELGQFDLKTPSEIMSSPDMKNERFHSYIAFLQWLGERDIKLVDKNTLIG